MSAENPFDTIATLTEMRATLVGTVLDSLRTGDRLNSRGRIEAIVKGHPNNNIATSTGGSFSVLSEKHVIGQRHRVGVVTMRGTIHTLRAQDPKLPDVVIFPVGINRLYEGGIPIFENPDLNRMRSIALLPPSDGYEDYHERPAIPLFNVEYDGTVLAQTHMQPTATELEFLDSILTRFESAITS
jgi:hypothetical protein